MASWEGVDGWVGSLGNGQMCGRAVPDLINVAGVLGLGHLRCVLVMFQLPRSACCAVFSAEESWRHQRDRAVCPGGGGVAGCCPVSEFFVLQAMEGRVRASVGSFLLLPSAPIEGCLRLLCKKLRQESRSNGLWRLPGHGPPQTRIGRVKSGRIRFLCRCRRFARSGVSSTARKRDLKAASPNRCTPLLGRKDGRPCWTAESRDFGDVDGERFDLSASGIADGGRPCRWANGRDRACASRLRLTHRPLGYGALKVGP